MRQNRVAQPVVLREQERRLVWGERGGGRNVIAKSGVTCTAGLDTSFVGKNPLKAFGARACGVSLCLRRHQLDPFSSIFQT